LGRIVGIVGDAKEYGLDKPTGEEVYVPISQGGFGGNLVARTSLDPAAMARLLREAIHRIDAHLAVDNVQTVERLEI